MCSSDLAIANIREKSSIIDKEALKNFAHKATPSICNLCGNKCNLTINRFGEGRKFISGNRCDKPLGIKNVIFLPNLYEYKLNKIKALMVEDHEKNHKRGKIGIPLGLNMYENIAFWHELLTNLDFEVVISDISTRNTFTIGQQTIPSDTVCYPAKLMHGHIENLLNKGINKIFYPCMGYNFESSEQIRDESTTNYNCPVVAYYPELLNANVDSLKKVNFYYPYFGLHRKDDFIKKSFPFFKKEFKVSMKEYKLAVESAYEKRGKWDVDIKMQG